jgi:organic hydroperoxide reductase OsmC/OhrA
VAGAAHDYELTLRWTGNRGTGTSGYRDYGRDHEVSAAGKPSIVGSSDPTFRGDATRWNPEELLVAALSQCHLLAYLHLASSAGIIVTDYQDAPVGTMTTHPDGTGEFEGVILHPTVTITDAAAQSRAEALHHDAHATCFIARSVNFPVEHKPTTTIAAT